MFIQSRLDLEPSGFWPILEVDFILSGNFIVIDWETGTDCWLRPHWQLGMYNLPELQRTWCLPNRYLGLFSKALPDYILL